MSDISELRDRVSHFDPNLILGHVAMLTIPESASVHQRTFVQLAQQTDITVAIPAPPRPGDVFKRACTDAQRNRVPTSDSRVFVNLMSRNVGQGTDAVWRRLVEERVDTEGHRLSYEEVYEIKFMRANNEIVVTALVVSPSLAAQEAVQSVLDYYSTNRGIVTAYTVREWVKAVMRSVSSTPLRDGVYFLRHDQAKTIADLEFVVNQLTGAMFHSVPLVDDRKQREMLKQAFESESIFEVDRIVGDISEILKDPEKKITVQRFANLKVEYDRIRSRVVEYSDMLDSSMSLTASRLEILHTGILEALNRVQT